MYANYIVTFDTCKAFSFPPETDVNLLSATAISCLLLSSLTDTNTHCHTVNILRNNIHTQVLSEWPVINKGGESSQRVSQLTYNQAEWWPAGRKSIAGGETPSKLSMEPTSRYCRQVLIYKAGVSLSPPRPLNKGRVRRLVSYLHLGFEALQRGVRGELWGISPRIGLPCVEERSPVFWRVHNEWNCHQSSSFQQNFTFKVTRISQ